MKTLLALFIALPLNGFAFTLDCHLKDDQVRGVKSVHFSEENIVINDRAVVELEKSQIKCGSFGRQDRYDGFANGYQIILRSCSGTAVLEGDLIDHKNQTVSEIACD